MRSAGRSAFIAGGLLLLIAGVTPAQQSSGGGGFTGSSGGSGSSGSSGSSGGFTGSSSGSSGGFTGSSSGSSGGMSRSSSGSNSTTGSTTPLGRYYGNPLYNGLATSQSSSASSTGSKYLRPSPVTVSFGTTLYDAASLTRSANQGTTGLGSQGSATANAFAGASSAGIRRAPGYITEPVFDMPARPTIAAIQPDLQGVVSRATRLPSRDRIQVLADGETIVLRGQVRDERERRLAEAMIRLSPGVRLVRNELEPDKKPPAK